MTTNFRRPSTNPARRTSSSISCVFKNAAAWYENGSITLEYIISDLVTEFEPFKVLMYDIFTYQDRQEDEAVIRLRLTQAYDKLMERSEPPDVLRLRYYRMHALDTLYEVLQVLWSKLRGELIWAVQ